uniref:Thioredoxin-like_fold domain-containing protein n=1 Tax=Heterorhabditis bacteriophora TaxID=37862 RepID=A0A1I7W762_HETBA
MKEDDSSLLVTLDYVINSSQFIIFFLTSGSKGSDLGLKLDNMVRKKNEKGDKDKPQNMKKKKKKEIDETAVISVVLVDTDYRSVESLSGSLVQPGWYVYAPQAPSTKSRLLRSLGFDFPPSLIVVDTTTRNVITTDARRLLAEDINGSAFPCSLFFNRTIFLVLENNFRLYFAHLIDRKSHLINSLTRLDCFLFFLK